MQLECLFQEMIELFGKTHALLIIRQLLLHHTLRFNELMEKVGGSPKTLTARLRDLEERHLVHREVFNEVTPTSSGGRNGRLGKTCKRAGGAGKMTIKNICSDYNLIPSPTFEELVTDYLNNSGLPIEEDTKKGIGSSLKVLRGFVEMEGVSCLQFAPDNVERFCTWLDTIVSEKTKDYLSPATKNKRVQNATDFFDYLVKRGLVLANPFVQYQESIFRHDRRVRRIRHQLERRKILPDKVTLDEFGALHAEAEKNPRNLWLPVAMEVAVNLTLRRGSVNELSLDKMYPDNDPDICILILNRTKTIKEAKLHPVRVPVSRAFYEHLKERIERRNQVIESRLNKRGECLPENYRNRLILSNQGHPVNKGTISKAFHELLVKVLGGETLKRRKLSFHSLRRTAATFLYIEVGFSLEEVSKLLGHAYLDTTIRYLRLSDEELARAYAKKVRERGTDATAEVQRRQALKSRPQKASVEIAEEIENIDHELDTYDLKMDLSPRDRNTWNDLHARRAALVASTLLPGEQVKLDQLSTARQKLVSLERDMNLEAIIEGETTDFGQFTKQARLSETEKMHVRMRELRNEGNGYKSIALMIETEFGVQYSKGAVRYVVNPEFHARHKQQCLGRYHEKNGQH